MKNRNRYGFGGIIVFIFITFGCDGVNNLNGTWRNNKYPENILTFSGKNFTYTSANEIIINGIYSIIDDRIIVTDNGEERCNLSFLRTGNTLEFNSWQYTRIGNKKDTINIDESKNISEYVTVRPLINRNGGVTGFYFYGTDFELDIPVGGAWYVASAMELLCNYMFDKGYVFIYGGMWGLDTDSASILFKKK